MSTIVTRLGKGSALTWEEADANVTNLNADKIDYTRLDDSDGSSLVGFLQTGTGAVPRTAQDKMRESVSVKDFGAVGDGVTDDTVAIQAAIAEAVAKNHDEVSASGLFNIAAGSENNDWGITYNNGLITQDDGAGAYALHMYPETGSFNQMLCWRLWYRLRSGGQLSIMWLGDSRSAPSGGFVSTAYEPQNYVIEALVRKKGIRNPMYINNRAVTGTGWPQISPGGAQDPVPVLNAAGPGVYDAIVIAMDVNDAGVGIDLADALSHKITYTKNTLANIRSSAYGTPSQLAIIVVGPTACHDPSTRRASLWLRKADKIARKLAMQYGCGYVDCFTDNQDPRSLGGFMQDALMVHPLDEMQAWWLGRVVDFMFPTSALVRYTSNETIGVGGLNGWSNVGGSYPHFLQDWTTMGIW